MNNQNTEDQTALLALTADVVSAFLAKNNIAVSAIPELISSVHDALSGIGKPKEIEPEKPTPAVPIKKTITPDYLISLEDGKRYKSLKRHLTGRDMTPADYRAKWGLPADYPMVAPNYAKQRSELAKAAGLGRKREPEPVPQPAPKGRRKAA
jgi:predicted transcriptional regulator